MSDEALIQQFSTDVGRLVKLREILDSEIVRQVRYTTTERSAASLMLSGCDYLIENLKTWILLLRTK